MLDMNLVSLKPISRLLCQSPKQGGNNTAGTHRYVRRPDTLDQFIAMARTQCGSTEDEDLSRGEILGSQQATQIFGRPFRSWICIARLSSSFLHVKVASDS